MLHLIVDILFTIAAVFNPQHPRAGVVVHADHWNQFNICTHYDWRVWVNGLEVYYGERPCDTKCPGKGDRL